ncbi:MAG TPA: hypothetical protein VNO52_04830 [Methylomirabilota bacterium]|nr:hypothetical protein [Methylomirabilota bacterium]
MISVLPSLLERFSFRMLGRAGLYMKGGGMSADESTVVQVILFIILGAFVGFVGGMLIANLVRFFSMFGTRLSTGAGWAVAGTVAGSLLFGVLALTDGKD